MNVQLENMGNKFRGKRVELGMTQKQLSKGSGVSQEGISKIERGGANPRFLTVVSLCECLEIDIVEFLPRARGNGIAAHAVNVK